MSLTCVIGIQWGDEGKGKIVDWLSKHHDLVVRFQGGSNAGHTVIWGSQKFILHLIPSGIFHKGVKCVIGNGVVIDPAQVLKEIKELTMRGIAVKNRLFISDRAHLVMPYHKVLDNLAEIRKGDAKIGTTGLGIGPAYVDKCSRLGLRMGDLYQPDYFKKCLKQNLDEKNWLITNLSPYKSFKLEKVYRDYQNYARKLASYVCDTRVLIQEALEKNQRILFEGAQGTLLNVDFGTYPFVTSSNSDISGVCAGTGIAPQKINRVIGIIKAYATRVGSGPFPTELSGEMEERLRRIGGEFGATTGRARRCGWLDLVSAKYAIEINGVTDLSIMKLDVLSQLKKIKVCVAYKYKNKTYKHFPGNASVLENCQPVYKEFLGWNEDVTTVRKYQQLPLKARRYLNFITTSLGVKIKMVSVGSERNQTIVL